MRNLSSAVLSLVAMGLSSMTTYLTFFDARYTLNAAVADVKGQSGRGYGSSNGKRSINFRFFAYPSIIVSNRGTRALVVSDVQVAKSDDLESCKVADDAERRSALTFDPVTNRSEVIEPFIVEPGTVKPIKMEIVLPNIDQEATAETQFQLQPSKVLWCMEWTVFDPNGRRHDSVMPAFTHDVSFSVEDGEDMPRANFKLDYPKGPNKLLARGVF